MNRMERIASVLFLVAALCLTLSIGQLWAASDAMDSHAVVEQAADPHLDAGHGADAAAPHGSAYDRGDWLDLGFRVMNFAVLVFILVWFGAKPIGSALANRQKGIRDELEELEQSKAEAEKSYREFEAKLATVEKDIDAIVEKAVAQAEVEKTRIIQKAEQTADDIKRTAELVIQNQVAEARRTLKNEAAEQAAEMAEELIVNNLTPEDQVKIIEDYLEKVGAVQ